MLFLTEYGALCRRCHISQSGKDFATYLSIMERVRKGGSCMGGTRERRMALWHTLCTHRQVTLSFLASKYSVSLRTIRYDVEALSRTYPIETRPGKNGGVKLADWYHPGNSLLSSEQMDLLLKLANTLEGDDAILMGDIIVTLSGGVNG